MNHSNGPLGKFRLIPRHAQEELDRQDAERLVERDRLATMTKRERGQDFRSQFAAMIKKELTLAGKWGAEADVEKRGGYEWVVRRIEDKYPPRKIGRFEKWLSGKKNKLGLPYFQFSPAIGLRGFIFNEGGRGVTLTVTRMCPFRLYVAGYVLTYSAMKKWSFRKFGR